MLAYRTPGVYFEWLDTQPAIQSLRTDIAGFVGIAERGLLHQAIRVESWTQFVSVFGAFTPQGYLACAVRGFFDNGGLTCWVVRVADPDHALPAQLDLLDDAGGVALHLEASSVGVWGQKISVRVVRLGTERFTLTIKLADGGQELWRDLTLDTAVATLDGSSLIRATRPIGSPQPPRAGIFRLVGGSDGLKQLTPAHLSGNGAPPQAVWGLAALENIDEISMLAMPDIMTKPVVQPRHAPRPPRCDVLDAEPEPPPVPEIELEFPPEFGVAEITELQRQLINQCERLKDRVAILDAPQRNMPPVDVIAWSKQFDTKYAALYYPWLRVPDPLELEGLVRAVPPSGHIAGIYARVDNRVGVHKPPANELIEYAQDVTATFDDVIHGRLNEQHVNAIRLLAGRGLRGLGARTLSSDPDWRYVNVRRLIIMIEEAIDQQLQWMVFEPNNPKLWRDTDRVVRSFLNSLWQRGLLDGNTAAEAFSVKCDAATNPPDVTDRGMMICQIGVQPPWPAEFVIVRIGKTENGTQVLEE